MVLAEEAPLRVGQGNDASQGVAAVEGELLAVEFCERLIDPGTESVAGALIAGLGEGGEDVVSVMEIPSDRGAVAHFGCLSATNCHSLINT